MVDENRTIVSVNPVRCRLWKGHDRIDSSVNEATCEDEIKSFLEHGQLIPVLGRRLQNDPEHDIELIYGARRLFVARFLNRPLLAELRDLSDKEAVIALDTENHKRKDLSPYERGMCYARWLRAGHFSSQEDIAKALKISTSQVSRLIRLARLPSVIVGAFESGTDICERWGLDIDDAIQDPGRRKSIIQRAREIGARPRPAAGEVFRQLLTPARRGRKKKLQAAERVIRSEGGVPILRIRQHRSLIAMTLPIEVATDEVQERIQHEVAKILDGQSVLHANITTQAAHRRRNIDTAS